MKALFENTRERGRGYGSLRLSEVADASSGGWRFSLCRGADQTYLGRCGWQNSEDFITPETYTASGDELVLHIGPDVVDRLDTNENYRIVLQGDGRPPQRATFAVTALYRTLMDTREHLASGTAPGPAEPAPRPVPEPEPAPMPASPAAPRKSPLLLPTALLLVAALCGGGAFWYMNSRKDAPEPAPRASGPAEEQAGSKDAAPPEKPAEIPEAAEAAQPEKPAEAPEAAEAAPRASGPAEEQAGPKDAAPPEAVPPAKPAEAAEPAQQAQQAEAAPPPPVSTRGRVNAYLTGTPTAPGARDLAARLAPSSAEEQDAVYRLWYFGAGAGDAAACFHLAQTVDPVLPPWGSIVKNGAEAWSLYAKAAPRQADAAAAMHALKQWLEQEAQKGNRDAIAWIRDIAEASAKK